MKRLLLLLLLCLTGCDNLPRDISGTYAYEWPTHTNGGDPWVLHGTVVVTGTEDMVTGVVNPPGEPLDYVDQWNWHVEGPLSFLLLSSDHTVWDDDYRLLLSGDDVLYGPMVPSYDPQDDHRGLRFRMVRQ
jgi:hypothetical protein